MVNRGGKVCLAAFPHEEVLVDIAHIVRNNIYVYGIRGEGKSATHRAEAFMAQKRFDATKIHTHTFALDDLPTAIRYAKDRVEDAIKVVVKARGDRGPKDRGGVASTARKEFRRGPAWRIIDARARHSGRRWNFGGAAFRGRPRRHPLRMATALPGALPVAVNGIRIAASIRPRKFVIFGGDETPVTMPRTAFQVVYPDCTVMLDSGLDKATHDSFSPDKPEPYFAEHFVKLERALNARARLIVLTHHHADHVAGVVTASNFAALAAKTIITMDVADCLMNTPHRPHLKLTQAAIENSSCWTIPNTIRSLPAWC